MQQTTRFETDDFKDGIVVARRNITGLFTLNENSKNLSFGTRDGIGPRYGTAPLPYHTHTQAALNSYAGYNLRTSEQSPINAALYNRTRYLFTLAFNAVLNDGITASTNRTVYLMCNQTDYQFGGADLDNVHLSVISSVNERAISASEKYGGYSTATGAAPAGLGGNFTRQIPAATLSADLDALNQQAITTTASTTTCFLTGTQRLKTNDKAMSALDQLRAVKFSFLTITGREFQIERLLALKSPSKAPVTSSPGNPGDLSLALTGNPNDYFYGRALDTTIPRNFVLLDEAASTQWFARYSYDYTSLAGFTRKPTKDMLWIDASYSFSNTVAPTIIDASANISAIVFRDQSLKHISNYKIVNIATGGKPLQYLWRDDNQSLSKRVYSGTSVFTDNKLELFNANNMAHFAPSQRTIRAGASSSYEEDNNVRSTVWYFWPDYTTGSASAIALPFAFGAANTGLLRANTSYEFTYSVFDKTLNYETNVGIPAKLRTGANDFVSLRITKARSVFGTPGGTGTPNDINPYVPLTWASRDWWLWNVNFREYRIYYRELGTFEWLPAAQIPCVEAHFEHDIGYWELCVNPIASLPGGQPGGFIDYSPLPEGNYIDTVTFANRTFWLSKSQLHFSLRNNPLAFPIRNAVACPNGEFLGIIPHAYPGQAEQGARLIIFGSKEIYTARFIVGAEEQARVRIGPDDAATFPVDGTNFIVDVWTSITAFSGRSAVVADGILYYWGPQGVYRDDGVAIPGKVSDVLEPWIDSIYDANNTDRIHAVFNSNTDEVIFFYQPPANGGTEQSTRAIVYHTKREAWSRWEFNDLVIDNAQVVENTKWDTDNDANAGTRIIVAVRDPAGTISRPMFLDEVIFAGDMQQDSQYMVTTVTHTTGTTRRLTFATGPASIASKTGTAIIQGFQEYTGNTSTNPDGIYTITASGANYIEVTRRSASADIPAGSYNQNEYFPVWLGSTAGIPVVMQSQYWAPGGMQFWGRWLYCHTSYQVSLTYDQSGTSYDIPVRYYSLPGTDFSTQTITLSDNSRGNCQILNSIPFTKDNASGQAIGYECVFTHYAGAWKLQYLGFDAAPQDKANIRFWEG